MNDTRLWATVAAAALTAALAPAAQAQQTVFDIEDAASDVVEEIEEDVQDDFDRDVDPFGNEGRELGYSGSVSLRSTATSGNDEETDVGIGARYNFFDGLNGGEINFALTYSEDRDAFNPITGEEFADSETNVFLSTEYTREFGANLYGYAQGVAVYDDNDDELDELEDDEASGNRTDIFVGVGLGYRIANSDRFQWTVQAGPGYRWIEPFDDPSTGGINEGDDLIEETAVSLSSDLLFQVSETVAVTNDTDVIASDVNTLVTNDLALNVALNETLSLRTNLLTEYNSDPLVEELEEVDNTFGVAVVYNF